MTDVHSKKVRSYNMSRIKGRNTKPEIIVRKFLHSKGLRFKLHDKTLSGKPDIVLPKFKTVFFIHGCFWHGHKDCKYFIMPKTRTNWWKEKIDKNIFNDKKHIRELKKQSWKIITVWECKLKSKQRDFYLQKIVDKIIPISSNK